MKDKRTKGFFDWIKTTEHVDSYEAALNISADESVNKEYQMKAVNFLGALDLMYQDSTGKPKTE